MKTLFFLVGLLGCQVLYAQSAKQNYADQLFAEFDYNKSSKVFEELAKNDLKKGLSTSENILKAARSYYLLNNHKKSAELYGFYTGVFPKNDAKFFLDALTRTNDFSTIAAKEEVFYPYQKDFSAEKYMNYMDEMANYQRQLVVSSDVNSGMGDFGTCLIDGNLYFSSSRQSSGDISSSKNNADVGSNIYMKNKQDKVVLVKELNVGLHNGPLTKDDKGNYYLTQTPHKNSSKGEKHVQVVILDASLKPSNKTFEFNNVAYNVGHVAFSHDYKKMYFVSDMPGGQGGSDIYYCIKQSNGRWSPPINFHEINTPFEELYPYEDKNGTLYFSSNGHIGLGGLDVFVYRHEKVENVGVPVNSSEDDFALIFSEPRKGYFSSNRNGKTDKIYAFEQLVFNGIYELSITDKKYQRAIRNLEMRVIDEENPKDTLVFKTNEKGLLQIPITSGKNYTILVPDKFQPNDPIHFNTDDLLANKIVKNDLFLIQDQYLTKMVLLDKDTKKPLTNVSGEFIDLLTGVEIPYYIDESGWVELAIDDGKQYMVTARKKGYLNKKEVIWASSESLLDLQLEMDVIKKNVSFEVKDILYAFNDYKLLDTSKAQMDELVEFLTVNDNISVELSSHTDARGSDEYNETLSQKRAQSCVDYLAEHGVDKKRIVAKGYGESRLLNHCANGIQCSEEEHQANRRTEIKILQVK